jgi:magnesium transporter
MPVVDEKNKLLGIITVDDVVDVIQEEATEDVQRMFGAGAEERLTSPWHFSFRKRVGWLVVNLATAFLAGWVVSLFDQTIEKVVVLTIYLPIVAGMGGNTSAQAMAVTIRGLAVGRVDRRLLWRVVFRETMVGVLTGVVIGLITAAVALGWQRSPWLGLVVGLALLINHTMACISGASIPFAMKKLGFDPAQSATIFATTVTDVVGFFSLLGLAYVFMKYLVPAGAA